MKEKHWLGVRFLEEWLAIPNSISADLGRSRGGCFVADAQATPLTTVLPDSVPSARGPSLGLLSTCRTPSLQWPPWLGNHPPATVCSAAPGSCSLVSSWVNCKLLVLLPFVPSADLKSSLAALGFLTGIPLEFTVISLVPPLSVALAGSTGHTQGLSLSMPFNPAQGPLSLRFEATITSGKFSVPVFSVTGSCPSPSQFSPHALL